MTRSKRGGPPPAASARETRGSRKTGRSLARVVGLAAAGCGTCIGLMWLGHRQALEGVGHAARRPVGKAW
jgi:hypothetical protein